MNMMRRNKQRIYIARRTSLSDDYGKPLYEEPFLFQENLAPVDSESEIKEYGERHYNMFKSVVKKSKWISKINVEDVVYLEGVTPLNEVLYGSRANYRVESIRTYLDTMTIYFEKQQAVIST